MSLDSHPGEKEEPLYINHSLGPRRAIFQSEMPDYVRNSVRSEESQKWRSANSNVRLDHTLRHQNVVLQLSTGFLTPFGEFITFLVVLPSSREADTLEPIIGIEQQKRVPAS